MKITRYCLFDPDLQEIASSEVFETCEAAVEAADVCDDILIVKFEYEIVMMGSAKFEEIEDG